MKNKPPTDKPTLKILYILGFMTGFSAAGTLFQRYLMIGWKWLFSTLNLPFATKRKKKKF